jgi:hypothetical protein
MSSRSLRTMRTAQMGGGTFPQKVSLFPCLAHGWANGPDDYILADRSTDVGRLIAGLSWGAADSTPPIVADGLCEA